MRRAVQCIGQMIQRRPKYKENAVRRSITRDLCYFTLLMIGVNSNITKDRQIAEQRMQMNLRCSRFGMAVAGTNGQH